MNSPDTLRNIFNTSNESEIERSHSLAQCVEEAMERYFMLLDGHDTTGLYDLVTKEVEAPMFRAVMAHTRNNQSKAAEILGLNRGTLRKKLKLYDLL